MSPFFLRWLVTTLAVAVAVQLVPGISAAGWVSLACMALVLGIINAIVRPLLLLLSLPFILVTLGFFILVLNALLFWLAGGLVPGFHVDGFWDAFFGSVIVSLTNWAFSSIVRGKEDEAQILGRREQIASDGEKVVQGRVIGE